MVNILAMIVKQKFHTNFQKYLKMEIRNNKMRFAFIFIVFIPLLINGQVVHKRGNMIDTVGVNPN